MTGVVGGDKDVNAVGDDGLGYIQDGKIIHYKASGAPSIELLN
ncbi:unnamed protein product [marine sediment metagenome]|uniref:Uncharacterized protein n=1 Tax=marine sediment metagenome TaxID=412755 RepID=X1SM61_9ZZZZ